MKTVWEAIVVVAVAALCAVIVNWKINPTPFPWVHEERPVTASSDSLLNSMMSSSPTSTATGTPPLAPVVAQTSVAVQPGNAVAPAMSHQDSLALKAKQDSLRKVAGTKNGPTAAGSNTAAQNQGQTAASTTTNPSESPSTKLPIEVTYEQILKLLANPSSVSFIDARKEEEHAKGALANSYNIDMIQFPADPEYRNKSMRTLYSIPKDKLIVAYCGGGNCELSHELCDVLIQMGFKKVFIYLGGWNEYSAKQGLKK